MQRRTFFKSLLLGTAAMVTPKITKLEAQALNDIPAPKPLIGTKAFVTTVKGPTAYVKHNLGKACVFVRAVSLDGREQVPGVESMDRDSVHLRFVEPWHSRRKVYKVVISC